MVVVVVAVAEVVVVVVAVAVVVVVVVVGCLTSQHHADLSDFRNTKLVVACLLNVPATC